MTMTAYSQKLAVSLSSISSTNDISQHSILSIHKDKFGLMWFGTKDGLNRYDGSQFSVYKHSDYKAGTLPSSHILSITEDIDGNLWLGTKAKGISRFKRSKRTFKNYQHNPDDAGSLSNDQINQVYVDKSGKLWVATEHGLNLFDSKSDQFKKFFHNQSDSETLSSSIIKAIYEDIHHNIWIGTDNGLNLLIAKSGKWIRFIDPRRDHQKNNFINSIIEDSEGQMWLGTSEGLNLFDKKTGSFKFFPTNSDGSSVNKINSIFTLAKGEKSQIWIGSNTTLQLFDTKNKQEISIADNFQEENFLPKGGIYSLLNDDSGILWIGTSSQGVLKYDKNISYFIPYKYSSGSAPSGKNIIRDVSEDNKGNLYLATEEGLDYFDRLKGTFFTHRHQTNNYSSLASDVTSKVLVNKTNKGVWVGTLSNGLDFLDLRTGKFKHYQAGNSPYQLNNNSVHALLEDRNGKIWIGTDGGGVNVLDPLSKKILKYVHDPNNPQTLNDNSIQYLFEDKEGQIWMSGKSNGINIFDPRTKSFSQLNTKNSQINSNITSVISEDNKGNIWIGTTDHGINIYNPKTKVFKYYNEGNGLVNNTINDISEDNLGFIWISTNKGIARFDPKNETFRNFGKHNGLKSMEFNAASGQKLKSGEIALGSINGFIIIAPNEVRTNNNKPKIVLTSLEILNKIVNIGTAGSPLKESLLLTDEITLNYLQSVFTLSFAALNFSVPEENTYAYKLEGFDDDWNFVKDESSATYTNLDPGTYIFRVIASNGDGVWNKEGLSLTIHITPPFWKTWWFRTIVVLALIGIIYLIFWFKIRNVKKQKEELQVLVNERTSQISKQAQAVEILNQELQNHAEILRHQKDQEYNARLLAEEMKKEAERANCAKTIFLATMSHEMRTPMNGVLGMAALLSETHLNPEQLEYTKAIQQSGESLLNVINDVLDFSKIESGNIELQEHHFNLKKCIEDVFRQYETNKKNKKVIMRYEIDDNIPKDLIGDSLRLRQILINLVGNAVKFTESGEIILKVSKYNSNVRGVSQLKFFLSDTGIGIPEEQHSNLFKAFHQLDSSITRGHGGAGLGLVICHRLINMMGGTIQIDSSRGAGTRVSFTIVYKIGEIKENEQPEGSLKLKEQFKKSDKLIKSNFAKEYPFKILIAEDNPMNQKVILMVLRNLGYSPDLANDGLEALEMMKLNQYNLILMDIQMPVVDGLEGTRMIRALYGMTPTILALTANSAIEDREACFKAGMNEFLTKPIDLKLLIYQLREIHRNKMQQTLV